MLFVKLKNAMELLWDSLDSEERRVLVYALAWFGLSVFAAVRRAQRDAFKREVLRDALTAQMVVSDGRE